MEQGPKRQKESKSSKKRKKKEPGDSADLLWAFGVFLFVCLFLFFDFFLTFSPPPIVLGHMLLTRFSAQERSTTAMERGTGAPGQCWTGRGGKPQGPHRGDRPITDRDERPRGSMSLKATEGVLQSLRTWLGLGICGRAWTCGDRHRGAVRRPVSSHTLSAPPWGAHHRHRGLQSPLSPIPRGLRLAVA